MRMMTAALFVFGLLCTTAVRADDAKVILDKAIKAHGGEEKLNKFPAYQAKSSGKVTLGEATIDFTGETYAQAPDKMRVLGEADFMGNKFQRLQVFNGKTGWVQMMGTTEEMTEEQMKEAKDQLYWMGMARLVPLKNADIKLTAVPEIKVNDKPAVGFKVSHKDHKDVTLYFDKESGRMVRMLRKAKDMMTGMDVDDEVTFSNYKEFDGIPVATKQSVKRDGKEFLEVEITEYKSLEKLDESKLNKP